MGTKIRFRSDSILVAEEAGRRARGLPPQICPCTEPDCPSREQLVMATPPTQPGDCWRLGWYGNENLSGFAICCPQCGEVHHWGSATNCTSRRELPGGGFTCDHAGKASCWTWTLGPDGAPTDVSPSLFAQGACGWHGWLRGGELVT